MRCIDADELKKVFSNGYEAFAETLCEIVDEQPTADVVPTEFHDKCMEIEIQKRMNMVEVKHGVWIDGHDVPKEERERHPYVYLHGEKYCSFCYKEAYFDSDYGQQLFDYCPNCGARMVSN